MSDNVDHRDRIANLRGLAVDSLTRYGGGFRELERVDRDLKWVIYALEGIADPAWTGTLISLWGRLEITYASALCDQRFVLRPDEELDMREAVGALLAEFARYEIPLRPEERPREYDGVRVLTPLPPHDFCVPPAATVVIDYAEISGGGPPYVYEVEFVSDDGVKSLMLTVPAEDLEVVWRPGYGPLPLKAQESNERRH
jgi:hypothetical protein